MSNYARNKLLAVYVNTQPSKTDQAGSKDTDINIIVRSHMVSGKAPGGTKPPMYEDFSQLPTDLRSMIETTRGIAQLRRSLPDALKEKPVEELLRLTAKDIQTIMNPPEPKPELKPDDIKEEKPKT